MKEHGQELSMDVLGEMETLHLNIQGEPCWDLFAGTLWGSWCEANVRQCRIIHEHDALPNARPEGCFHSDLGLQLDRSSRGCIIARDCWCC
jgi:hypothetical protein